MMDEPRRLELAERAWAVEEHHRVLKQRRNIERRQARSGRAQRNHVGMAIRAFARLSWHFHTTGVSWREAKTAVARDGRSSLSISTSVQNLACRATSVP